jgi:hypothetical protein
MTATLHVLLIGIDAYPDKPLTGCINDIDAVERRLRARLRDTRLQIRRLASAVAMTHSTTTAQPATLANLRAELDRLATVAPDDRVFIYYAGHGSRIEVIAPNGMRLFREALVPVDHNAVPRTSQVLFDYELNEKLRAIVARTHSVALVLDCCHSSGVTRTGPDHHVDRCIDLPSVLLPPDPAGGASPGRLLIGAVDHCQVVAACFDHERAREARDDDGVRHGLLTAAFVAALDALPDVDLREISWSQIWPAIYARVTSRHQWQHPRIFGHHGRAVFAGPPVLRDPGLPVNRTGDTYEIGAGELTGITDEARIAVYPATIAAMQATSGTKTANTTDDADHFPPIDSSTDHAARLGVLRVTHADKAVAKAVAETAPFDLPDGARARLISTGVAARLRYAMLPSDPWLEQQLAKSRVLERARPGSAPLVTLEHAGGRWFITDDLHGASPDRPMLCSLAAGEIDRARQALEHYHRYWQPLRLASLANDLPRALELRVLQCPHGPMVRAIDAQQGDFPELFTRHRDTYVVAHDVRICFAVHNRSTHRLRVALINAAASGRVQWLGEEDIEPGAMRTFWAGGTYGAPFHMLPPDHATMCIDRLVAIGRTRLKHDLRHLCTETRFSDAIAVKRGDDRKLYDGTRNVPQAESALDAWTSAQAVIETHAR